MPSQHSIKKHLALRGSLERKDNARRRRPRRRAERSILLRVSPNVVSASHTIDIWHRHAITLVLNARVQRGCAPLGVVAGAVHGRCGLENNVGMLKINVIHRRCSPLVRKAEADWRSLAQVSMAVE
jgi:hypothetical protein